MVKNQLMKKKRLFTIHSVSGLFAGVFILVLSLSGALLVFHDEIDALQKPKVGLYDRNKKILTVNNCYAIIKQQYPDAVISNCTMPDKTSSLF